MRAHGRDLRATPGIVRAHVDILTKAGLGFCVGHTLAPLGLDLPPVVAAIPTERFIIRRRVVDFAFHLANDIYVDIEQFTGDHLADLYHVQVGAAILAEERRRPVQVIVVYTGPVRSAPDTLDSGSLHLRVRNVFGADLDGDAALAALQAKVAAGTGLQGEDAMAVAFLGVMRHTERPLAVALREGLRLAATLPTEREREGCAAAVVMLGQRRLGPSEIAELVEVFAVAAPRMADVLERMGREKGKAEGKAEGRAEGKAEGRAEGKAEDVLRVLRHRYGEPAAAVARRVSAERDLATLDRWLDLALTCAGLADFSREVFGREG